MSGAADRTHRVVKGALTAAINDHGPITPANVNSATKRVVAQLRSAAEHATILGCEGDAAARAAIEAGHKRYSKLRHAYDRLEEHNGRLRAQLEALQAQQVAS